MFSFLKKKLKEGVEKLSAALTGEKPAPPPEPPAAPIEPSISPSPPELEQEKKEEKPPAPQKEERIPTEPPIEEKPREKEEVPLPTPPEEKLPPEKPKEVKPAPEILEKEPEIEKKILREEKKIEKELKKPPAEEKKQGFLEKIKKAVKEKEIEEKDITPILLGLETGLLESDVALEVTEKIVSDLRRAIVGKTIKRSEDLEALIRESLKKSILEVLSVPSINIEELAKQKKPLKIVFLGFNGAGKTTSIARLAYYLKNKGFSVI